MPNYSENYNKFEKIEYKNNSLNSLILFHFLILTIQTLSFRNFIFFYFQGTVNLEAGCTSSRLLRKPQQNPHELLVGGRRAPASSSTTTTRGCWHQEDKEDGNLVLRWPRTRLPDPCETPTQPQKTHQNLLKNNVTALSELKNFFFLNPNFVGRKIPSFL